jgi:hypothetical protein
MMTRFLVISSQSTIVSVPEWETDRSPGDTDPLEGQDRSTASRIFAR